MGCLDQRDISTHHQVGHNGERADAHAAKRGGSRDVAVQLLLQALHRVAVTLQRQAAMHISMKSDKANFWRIGTCPCGGGMPGPAANLVTG